jgi:predicted dehydrogenase
VTNEAVAIGLVGCGGMGRRHLRAYRALSQHAAGTFEIAAVCDPVVSAAEQAADIVGQFQARRPTVCRGHEDLIALGAVDAVDIVTEPAIHHTIAVPALEAGLHVLCEKPLSVTVRGCRAIVDAAAQSGATLGTAENYRRDGPNRLAKAVLQSGLLGDIHLMTETNIGGDDGIIISPWRHLRESGSIALDMGVHYTDVIRYYLGELDRVAGRAFIAEPLRRLSAGGRIPSSIEQVGDGLMTATGDDSLVALFETKRGVLVELTYLPSGPGRQWTQRSVHGRNGSMSVPRERTGEPVVVRLGEETLTGGDLREAVGGFEFAGVTRSLLGREGTEYKMPFETIDAALIAIEIEDFLQAIRDRRAPEVDGLAGLHAVADVWAVAEAGHSGDWVSIADVANGAISAAQDEIDEILGLIGGVKTS